MISKSALSRSVFVRIRGMLVLVALAAGASPLTAQTSGLVASYGFEEGSGSTVVDSSGNSNSGTLGSGVRRTNRGKFGDALTFNGNSMASIPETASLDLSSAMTLEAWVYPTSAPTDLTTVLMKEQTGDLVYSLFAGSAANRPIVCFNTSTTASGQRQVSGTAALPLNTWSHLAGTYDGANLRLYVNGVLVAAQNYSGPIQTSGGALRLGGNAVWGQYFKGRIDEVRLYSRALALAEVQSDMNAPVVPAP